MAADFSQYVDLTIYDVQPVDIYLGAIDLARRTLPEFTLRQGTPEDALFQAFSYMSALSVGTINRLPPRLMEGLVKMVGMERRFGTRARVVVDMTARDNDDETVIPAGTVFGYTETVAGVSAQYTFQLAEEVIIPGHITTPQTEQAILYSQNVGLHPVLTAGDVFVSLSIVSGLESVVVAETISIPDPPDATYPFVNGVEPESDVTYLSRARTFLSSLNETLVTAKQVQSYVLANYESVGRCYVVDLTKYDETGAGESTRIGGSSDTGYITIYAYGNKQLLQSADQIEISADVAAKSTAGLSVGIDDFFEASVDIEIEVIYDDSMDEEIMVRLIQEFVFNAVSRETFPLAEQHLRTSYIASVASSIDGVLSVGRVSIIDYPSGYSLNSNGDLEFLYKATLPIVGKASKTVARATTASLTATYSNGTSGVGATLTNSGAQAALQIDGSVVSVSDRILVKNQAGAAQNGIYTVTTVGSGSTNWVLTRATDYDNEINFVIDRGILVSGGSTLSGDVFAVSTLTTAGDAIGTLQATYSDITSTYSAQNNGFMGAVMVKATGRAV